jgi:hypothetical protein
MGIPHQSTLYISTYQIGRGFAINSLFFINRRSDWGDQVAIAQQGIVRNGARRLGSDSFRRQMHEFLRRWSPSTLFLALED